MQMQKAIIVIIRLHIGKRAFIFAINKKCNNATDPKTQHNATF